MMRGLLILGHLTVPKVRARRNYLGMYGGLRSLVLRLRDEDSG